MPLLLFATSNSHKIAEVAAILGPECEVVSLRDRGVVDMPEETGDTFAQNAAIKALAISRLWSDLLVLADDSGLQVDALHGRPGVHSARYAGPQASDADNRGLLIAELRSHLSLAPESPLTGRFQCHMTLAKNGQILSESTGSVEGHLLLAEEGSGGFGYDPLFVPEGYEQSFGTLPAAVKNQLSHRARALAGIKQWLQSPQHGL